MYNTCTQESLIFPQFIFLVIEMMIDFINIALKYNAPHILYEICMHREQRKKNTDLDMNRTFEE